jgi:MFS family permease
MTAASAAAGHAGRPGLRFVAAAAMVVPLLLTIVGEAAWIAVVAGLLQEYALREPVIGLPQLAAFVLAGVLTARLFSGRLGLRWPLVSLGLIASGAAIGLFLAPSARSAVDAGGLQGIGSAIGENPGGLFAGLAVLRGFSHARQPLREDTLGRMFGGGIVAIAFSAMAGGLVAEPWRSTYLAEVLTDSLVFAATAVVALALTRQSAVGVDSQVDWPRNPAWVGLLVLLVAIVVVLAVPAAAVAPSAIDLAVAILLAPLLIIGLVAGWTRSGARLIGIVLLAAGLIIALRPRLGAVGQTAGTGTAGPDTSAATPPPDQSLFLIGGGLLTVVGVIGVLLLVRLWMRRTTTNTADVDEVRTIDRGSGREPRTARRPRLPFRRSPVDAVSAYRALMDDLEHGPPVRRDPAETPAEHARRLRATGHAGLSLDLLAADYALAQFGDVALTNRENRRAVARWRGLRAQLSRVTVSRAGPATALPPEPD